MGNRLYDPERELEEVMKKIRETDPRLVGCVLDVAKRFYVAYLAKQTGGIFLYLDQGRLRRVKTEALDSPQVWDGAK